MAQSTCFQSTRRICWGILSEFLEYKECISSGPYLCGSESLQTRSDLNYKKKCWPLSKRHVTFRTCHVRPGHFQKSPQVHFQTLLPTWLKSVEKTNARQKVRLFWDFPIPITVVRTVSMVIEFRVFVLEVCVDENSDHTEPSDHSDLSRQGSLRTI